MDIGARAGAHDCLGLRSRPRVFVSARRRGETAPVSLRRPIASVLPLLVEPRWLTGSGLQVGGFVLYVVALALAPLSLVQATAAGGIGDPRHHGPADQARRAQQARAGRCRHVGARPGAARPLVFSSPTAREAERRTSGSGNWAGSLDGWRGPVHMAARTRDRARTGRGIASGILFAAVGDVATKMAVSGGLQNVAFLVCLIVFYGAGTAVLQAAFQRGGALTTAGLSTPPTNALPIVAGTVLFHEPLPSGVIGVVRVAAFAVVVAGAVLLAAPSEEAEPRPPGHRPIR